jgi:cholesterol oxidase
MRADFDAVVVGSGFGGSVAALRLQGKGYRVAVLEAGRRFEPDDFPTTSWDARRYLFAPRLRCNGMLRLTLLRDALVLSGAGVGGGSLVYANVLHEPADYESDLATHFETVRKMLGATPVPVEGPADAVLRQVSERMGMGKTFRPTEVAVDFDRCTLCGGCMIGCRQGAKNTLDRTYLASAEKLGAVVLPEHEVRKVRRTDGAWEVITPRRTVSAEHVVLAAGVLGTLPLLFGLPVPPLRTGFGVRTNSETLVGATSSGRAVDYSRGVAIGSAFQPDSSTQIQAVRYPRGSNLMGLLGRPLSLRDWAERTVILLCMGTGDDELRLVPRGRGLASMRAFGRRPPVEVASATRAAIEASAIITGRVGRFRLDRAITAHILGGACPGDSPRKGVVDRHNRVFGYPGLHVMDSSTVAANLGVNPALTIAAQAERAMAAWPHLGERDLRPALDG